MPNKMNLKNHLQVVEFQYGRRRKQPLPALSLNVRLAFLKDYNTHDIGLFKRPFNVKEQEMEVAHGVKIESYYFESRKMVE